MHPKVLIIGTVPYNRQTTARAFESYFSKWERENLIQIFSNPKQPLKGHCSSLYQITDKMMLEKHFNKNNKVGKLYRYEELKDDEDDSYKNSDSGFISKLYKMGKKKNPLNYLLRKWLWKKKYWCTDELNEWLENFKPECIFLAFSDDFFVLEIALYVAKKFNVPIISCIGDDYYFNKKVSLSPFYYIYRKKYKKIVKKVFEDNGSAIYIGNKIRDKYNKEFGLNGETVYLSSEIKRHQFKVIDKDNPYISYCGNIRLGRNHSLNEIGCALGKINSNYKIHIYSNEINEKYIKELRNNKNIEYHGTVSYEKVKDVMEKSDIVLVVEGFSKENIRITKYSLSTKVADSLVSGSSVFSYGAIDCGAIEYMKEIECGPVCINKNQLIDSLKKLIEDEDYQLKCYKKTDMIINSNHNLDISNKIFEDLVYRVIKENRMEKNNEK